MLHMNRMSEWMRTGIRISLANTYTLTLTPTCTYTHLDMLLLSSLIAYLNINHFVHTLCRYLSFFLVYGVRFYVFYRKLMKTRSREKQASERMNKTKHTKNWMPCNENTMYVKHSNCTSCIGSFLFVLAVLQMWNILKIFSLLTISYYTCLSFGILLILRNISALLVFRVRSIFALLFYK